MEPDMTRRRLLRGATLAAAGAVASAQAPAAESSAPPLQVSAAAGRLIEAIRGIPAFNNHLHLDSGKDSFDWYAPRYFVGRSERGSRGLLPLLQRMLDMPEGVLRAEDVEELRQRYYAFCDSMSRQEYYHRLADLTNTTHIAFISLPHDPVASELASDRLKLVVHIDQFPFPLDATQIGARHKWQAIRLGVLAHALEAEEQILGPRPQNFAGYLDFVRRALEAHRNDNSVIGGKWSFAYFRPLSVEPVTIEEAAQVYESADARPGPYRRLQDFLAAYTLQVCREIGFPLQIHTGLGADAGLILTECNPALLDSLLAREDLASVRVACLHGGYPFCRELGLVAKRPNVYLDFSWMVLLFPPHTLAGFLKEWIEFTGPNKLLFGVDGSGLCQIIGTWCAREALAIALGAMVDEEQMTEAEAIGAATAILRTNAEAFYALNQNTGSPS